MQEQMGNPSGGWNAVAEVDMDLEEIPGNLNNQRDTHSPGRGMNPGSPPLEASGNNLDSDMKDIGTKFGGSDGSTTDDTALDLHGKNEGEAAADRELGYARGELRESEYDRVSVKKDPYDYSGHQYRDRR